MARYLMTQSLLSSWAYAFDCSESNAEEAKEAFIRSLKREPSETNQAMLDGQAFEREVYAAAAGAKRDPHPKWENGIQKVATIIQGAPVQVKASREIEVCGFTFLVYGILDALKAGVIYDVKYKVKSFGSLDLAGYYLDSAQHPAYLYIVPEAREFQYLVSDGEDLYVERYTRQEARHIGDILGEFIPSITDMGLLDCFKENWSIT